MDDNKSKALLGAFTPVIHAVNADINISGYTDTTPSRVMSNEDLSALRAISVLEYFLHEKVQPQRFVSENICSTPNLALICKTC